LKQINNNDKINYDIFSLNKGKNEQIKENNQTINENILFKSKISSLEKIIINYEKQINDFNKYMNLFYNFFRNINQISMNQLNIDINQFKYNKFIDINAFQNILNKIETYVAFLLNELNTNMTYTNKNNINDYQNEIEDNYNDNYNINNNKVYDNYNIQNINKMNEQYEIYKTLEERINLLEKEINMQKQNFNNNTNIYDINKKNGTERIKKKRVSKKKLKTVNNIYELSQEEPKIFDIKSRQKNNKKVKNINKDNPKNQLKENRMIFNSNRKYRFNIKDKEIKKRSVTPLNSKLKKYFN
jgi:hypothetical protein